MNVILFQPQFPELILSGIKLSTIRARRRDGRARAKVGEFVSLRIWTGLPYRSKQREFAQAMIRAVYRVAINERGITRLDFPGPIRLIKHKIAWHEGFDSWPKMRAWFTRVHGLPFEGEFIKWTNVQPTILKRKEVAYGAALPRKETNECRSSLHPCTTVEIEKLRGGPDRLDRKPGRPN